MVKGGGYGPGSQTLSPACSTPGATTPDVVPPTPPGPALPAPGESMYTRTKYQQGRRPSPPCRGRGTGLARWWGHKVLKGPNTLAVVRSHFPGIQQRKLQTLRPCSYPYTPLLSAGPAKYRLSPMPPPPSLRMVPRPSQGGLWDRPYHQFSTAAKCPMGLLLGP